MLLPDKINISKMDQNYGNKIQIKTLTWKEKLCTEEGVMYMQKT